MKVCPFCREEIRDDAIKCRYCSSSLLPPQKPTETLPSTPTPGAGQVVYVLDEGLIKFGKFMAGILAVFIACGVFFYGFDLKQTGEEVRKSADTVRDSAQKAAETSEEIQKARDTVTQASDAVAKGKSESETLLAAARESTASLDQQIAAVEAAEENMRRTAAEIESARRSVGNSQLQIQNLQERAASIASDIEKTKQGIRNTEVSIGEAVKAISAQQEKTSQLASDVLKAKESVSTTKDQAEGLLARAEELVNSIREQNNIAITFVAGMVKGNSSRSENAGRAGANSAVPLLSVPDLAAHYNFPTEFTGIGQTIGIISLEDGYQDSDLDAYFASLKLRKPSITGVSVKGVKNRSRDAQGEVTMEIEIAGAAAPGASFVVYFAGNSNTAFLDAVRTAATDSAHNVSLLLIGWASPETMWRPELMMAMNSALKAAADRGITVLVPSGNEGATIGGKDRQPPVYFPASSPWVLACGGTQVRTENNVIRSEEVWDALNVATGGGMSDYFAQPDWQARTNTATGNGRVGRAIPDVAALASPQPGYKLLINGQTMQIGGTGAAASLWAGLLARINQALGHNVGYVNPVLYSKLGPAGVLRSVAKGTNSSGCSAGPGWTPCVGWGTPDGRRLLSALQANRQ